MSRTTKTIEERYQKVDPYKHVILRPDMYIGNTKEKTIGCWIANSDKGSKLINKEITYVPGFYKIFDEIIVNAADETKRCNKCNFIKVNIDQDEGIISVWNNGVGIPVVEHKDQKMYVPSLIFGELLAGESFDDNEKKVVGGRNGLGAKLTNIYSTEFIVENCDGKKKFKQIFKDNMSIKGKAKVSDAKKNPYTEITFKPDLEKFKMDKIDDDVFALFKKRVYDIAMTTGAKVSFNGEMFTPLSFQNYINLFFPEGSEHKKVIDISQDRWKVGVVFDPTDEVEHQNISFVNSLCTLNGGTHVEHVSGQIVRKLQEIIKKKSKMNIKPNLIKENLIFFVDATIEDPTFDGQSKDVMTLKATDFGSKFTATDAFIKKIANTGVVEKIIANAKMKEEGQLMKNNPRGSLHDIEGLYDAQNAGVGKRRGEDRVLCLTEGKSARGFAMKGFNEIGRENYGVFPLRGKLKNVRGKSMAEISKNEEIEAIRRIMGLIPGKVYKDTSELRYDKIACLTDQDSVTADTPLLLKNINGLIDIQTIDNISDEWFIDVNGKEYSQCDYKIWTDSGWTNIVKIIRHKVTKPIYRVLTHTGVVDVTEDHSLVKMNGDEISPNNCKVGDLLLHNFPRFDDNKIVIPSNLNELSQYKLQKYASLLKIQYYNSTSREKLIEEIMKKNEIESLELNSDFNISTDEAYLMGFFWANGTCGVYKFQTNKKSRNGQKDYIYNRTSYNWSITNANMDFLLKSKEILLKYYGYDVSIVTCSQTGLSVQPTYKLIVNGGKKILPLVEKYRSLFYDKDKKKRVPLEILNASYDVRNNFLIRYDHDINDMLKFKRFDIDSKIGAHGIFFLCKSLGYEVSINHNIKKPNVYSLCLTKDKQQSNPNIIKKMFCLGSTEQYVYDLETVNHHFQGGIGKMILHNTDGSHIKGLIMNYIHCQWPSLLKNVDDFMICISTPIVKVSKGKKVISFKTLNDFEDWKKANNDGAGWTPKYYKGLGTSESAEAREVFCKLDENTTYYYWDPEIKQVLPDYQPKMKDCCEDALTLGFSKGREDDRKDWINLYDPNIYLKSNDLRITFAEFIHKELIAFSTYSVARAVPHLMDGFKPGQRKIFYGSIKKNMYSDEIRVAQLAGYISEHTGYHHGEASLHAAITAMAQDFVGSNNINLFLPKGDFGTRLAGGEDAASPRYIHTLLNPLCKKIFNEHDSGIYNYVKDDGDTVEPVFYAPIIPMILINGSKGIGTGWSTTIYPCNPLEVCQNIKRILAGKETTKMAPWIRNFSGVIEQLDKHSYAIHAVYEVGDDWIHVKDLPVGTWTDNYKKFLDDILAGTIKKSKKEEPKSPAKGKKTTKGGSKTASKGKTKVAKTSKIREYVKTYTEDNTDVRVSFTIKFFPGKLKELIASGKLEKELKLVTTVKLTNMHLFDENGKITKYPSYGAILRNFVDVRLEMYQTRKDYLLGKWDKESDILRWKMKFIDGVLSGKIIMFEKKKPRSKKDVMEQIEAMKFPKFAINDEAKPTYKYITDTGLFHLTEEDVEALRKRLQDKEKELATLKTKSPKDLWNEELDDFMETYKVWDQEVTEKYAKELTMKKKDRKKKDPKGKAPKK